MLDPLVQPGNERPVQVQWSCPGLPLTLALLNKESFCLKNELCIMLCPAGINKLSGLLG